MTQNLNEIWDPLPARVVDSRATLTGVLIPQGASGALVYVDEVGIKDYYCLDLTSGAPIDGTNVLATTRGGASRWLKTNITSGGGGGGGLAIQNEGTPLPGNPQTTMNVVGLGAAARINGGVAELDVPAGDSAYARQVGPRRTQLQAWQNNIAYRLLASSVMDGSGPAGVCAIAARRLLFGGVVGGNDGQVYSMELGGFQTGLEIDLGTTLAGAKTPESIAAGSIDRQSTVACAVTNSGVATWFTYEAFRRSPPDLIFDASSGSENWADSRLLFVNQSVFGFSFPAGCFIWTAPAAGKVYGLNVYGAGGLSALVTAPGESPKPICIDPDGFVWVGFNGSNTIRKYRLNQDTSVPPTLTLVATYVDATNFVNMADMVSDGRHVWVACHAPPRMLKLDLQGNLVATYSGFFGSNAFNANTRLAWDGLSVWATGNLYVSRFYAAGDEIYMVQGSFQMPNAAAPRGIAVDPFDERVYLAGPEFVGFGAVAIMAFDPTNGTLRERHKRTVVWSTGVFGMPTTFSACQIPSQTPGSSPEGRGIRSFDFVIEGQIRPYDGSHYFRRRVQVDVDDDGVTMTLLAMNLIAPDTVGPGAAGDGWTVTITGGLTLDVTVTQGITVGQVDWTVHVEEMRSFTGGNL
jgi:hypothetical protein